MEREDIRNRNQVGRITKNAQNWVSNSRQDRYKVNNSSRIKTG